MATAASSLSGNLLYRHLGKTVELLEAAARKWARKAQRGETLDDQAAELLRQMTLLCLRAPELMRAVWEWGKAEDRAGRLRNRRKAGEILRDQLGDWLRLLGLIRQATTASAADGFPIKGAAKLSGAAAEMRATVREVVQTWLRKRPIAKASLKYKQLERLADRLSAPAQWYEEDGDLF
jgi:hypothetical protein